MIRQLGTALMFAYAPAIVILGLVIANPSGPETPIDPLPNSEVYEEGCCADRNTDPADMEIKNIPNKMIWFLDPMDISRANIPARYKGANYLLFTDGTTIFVLDLTNPANLMGGAPLERKGGK